MPLSPEHICAVYRNHMCPRSVKQEVKDDRKGTLRKQSKQEWMMLSGGLDGHGQEASGMQLPRALGCTTLLPITERAPQGDGCQPRETESNASKDSPKKALHPLTIHIFFGRKTCLFGERDESTRING